MYDMIAATGHSLVSVQPTYTQIPRLKGSVFDALIWICIACGDIGLSMAMSPNDRWAMGS